MLVGTTALCQTIPNQVNAANATGVQAYNAYAGARENIGLANGNLNQYIPLVTLPGRDGHNLEIGLEYHSKIWGFHEYFNPYVNYWSTWWDWERRRPSLADVNGWRVNIPVPGASVTATYSGCIDFGAFGPR